jgi:hypothetical protein
MLLIETIAKKEWCSLPLPATKRKERHRERKGWLTIASFPFLVLENKNSFCEGSWD